MRITENTSDTNMKVFFLSILCALSGYVAGGAIGWPGAVAFSEPSLKTIVPGETKTTAYSTTQYINSLPSSYSFGGHPQISYHVPQLNSYAPLPAGYYHIGSPSYIPATSVIYPGHPSLVPAFEPSSIPGVSIIPGFPSAPSFPGSPTPITPPGPAESPNVQSPPLAGDEDSAVIESAAGAEQENTLLRNQPSTSQPTQSAAPQFQSSNTFPNFLSNSEPQQPQGPTPSFPQQPLIPQIPQNPQNIANNPTNFPQKPHGSSFPQPNFPEGSKPSFPYLTPTSPNPQASTPNFPQIPQTSQNPQASAPPSHQPSNPHSPQISQTPQNSFPQFTQIPQNPQGAAPLFPQQPHIPHFPHDLTQLPQISQNPQGPIQFYPQIGQNPHGPAQAPPQSGQIFSQYPQLTQDFGQNVFSEEPSQSFSPSFPGANTDSSSLNNEDTISVESA